MKGEINRDWYCLSNNYSDEGFCLAIGPMGDCPLDNKKCEMCHRKWPTPEQFRKEYDEEYMDASPVWAWYNGWTLMSYRKAKDSQFESVVCACTPWGKPPADWRPE